MKTEISWLKALLFLSIFAYSLNVNAFIHPGIPFNTGDLNRMKANKSIAPWSTGYSLLTSIAEAQLTYKVQGPFDTVGREANLNLGQYQNDSEAVLYQAIQFYITGNATYATNAIAILEAWTTTHKIWTGSTPFLAATDYGLNFVMGAEILRYTYSGWSITNTSHSESYFLNILWPQFTVPNPLRAANQGAAQLKGAMAVAVFCNDQTKFDQVVESYKNDVCGGVSNTLPNGENGDSGRDQPHSLGMIGNLAFVAEVAWRQNVDLYSLMNNRLLAVHDYFCKYNSGNTVNWTNYGTCYGYYTSIGSSGRGNISWSTMANEMIYGAYAVRKGLSALNVWSYRNAQTQTIETFLYRKDTDISTAAATSEPIATTDLPSTEVTNFIGKDIGTVGLAGSNSYNGGDWTVKGAGSDIWGKNSADGFYFTYQMLTGDGEIIARFQAMDSTNVSAKAGIMIRETLAPTSKMLAVYGMPSSAGSSSSWRGATTAYALSQGYQTDGLAVYPMWYKIIRRGSLVSGFISPDGVSWTPISYASFSGMSGSYYFGLAIASKDLTKLNTTIFNNVKISTAITDFESPLDANEEVMLFPNPVKKFVKIITPENSIVPIDIIDSRGVLIISKTINSQITQIDLSKLTCGIYFVKLNCGGKVVFRKLIKE